MGTTYCRKKLLHVECRLSKIKEAFSAHIDIELPHMFIMTDGQQESEYAKEEEEEVAVTVNPVAEESDSHSDNESDEGDLSGDIFLISLYIIGKTCKLIINLQGVSKIWPLLNFIQGV